MAAGQADRVDGAARIASTQGLAALRPGSIANSVAAGATEALGGSFRAALSATQTNDAAARARTEVRRDRAAREAGIRETDLRERDVAHAAATRERAAAVRAGMRARGTAQDARQASDDKGIGDETARDAATEAGKKDGNPPDASGASGTEGTTTPVQAAAAERARLVRESDAAHAREAADAADPSADDDPGDAAGRTSASQAAPGAGLPTGLAALLASLAEGGAGAGDADTEKAEAERSDAAGPDAGSGIAFGGVAPPGSVGDGASASGPAASGSVAAGSRSAASGLGISGRAGPGGRADDPRAADGPLGGTGDGGAKTDFLAAMDAAADGSRGDGAPGMGQMPPDSTAAAAAAGATARAAHAVTGAQGAGGSAAAAQAAASAGQTPPVPIGQVPMTIGLRSLQGSSEFQIRLDPAELGRIEVKLEIDKARGTVMTHLVVDRVDTLALLQRDAGQLQQALSQAGLDPSGGGLNMSLRGDGGSQGDARGGQGDPSRGGTAPWTADRAEAPQEMIAPTRWLRGYGGVDIRI